MIWLAFSILQYTAAACNIGPNGHLFYVSGDLMMRRGMLPIIVLPDGDLHIVLDLVPFFFNFDYLGECSH